MNTADQSMWKEFQEYIQTEKTMALMTHRRIKKYGDKPLLHFDTSGTWESLSWKDFGIQVNAVSCALLELGLSQKDKVGIYSLNRPEWHIADMGALSIRLVDVPIYATDSSKEALYIINNAELRLIFVGSVDQYNRIMAIIDQAPTLEHVVVFDRNISVDKTDPRIIPWKDFLAIGMKSSRENDVQKILSEGQSDDIATIIYTSGTTGAPKGAMITHLNLLHEQWSVGNYVLPMAGEDDVSLCFLPLSHIFERSYCYGIYMKGAQMYYCPDPSLILEYMAAARPTIMNSVPRLYEKVFSTIYAKLDTVSLLKRNLFHWAVAVGKEVCPYRQQEKRIPPLKAVKYLFAKKLVLDKIRNAFSHRAICFSAGGAALSREIAEFMYNAGIPLLTGYGLTETTPVVTANSPMFNKLGTNGRVIPLVDVRIDPSTGEILVKGPNVFKGYYNNPEATKAAFTDDGWFRTGDVGYFDEDGCLLITDRIKDLIITSGGKNIAPQIIETAMAEEYFIEHAVVIGEGRKYISALIIPSFEALEEYAKGKKIPFSSREELIAHTDIIALFQEIVDRRCRDYGQVEKIKRFTLLPEPFSQETGEITPTMKIKRRFINDKFKDLIETMYTD